MAIPISNVTRRAVYAPSGAGGAGPYAFTFEILANTDIAVFKDDTLLTLTTHYTVTINANGTGSVLINATGLALAPLSPTQYAIVGNRTISRTTDFTTGGDFFANTLNDELDSQTIFAQQNAEGLTRALTAPQTDPTTIDMTLPRAADRANKTLAFDAVGDPTLGISAADVANAVTYATNAAASATASAASAAAAASSASSATSSASTATTQATNASTSASSATSSASSAGSSASTAGTQAAAASASASNAAASASTATTQATNASSSASSASSSATSATAAKVAAEAARDSALAAYDNFDDRYLGAKSSNPTLDNDGNALLAGALYYNTTVPEMRLYTGSAWVAAYVSGAGFVAQSSSTGSAYLPVGTTGQRDGSPSAGYLRFNTTTTQFEGYNGTAWSSVGGAVIVNDTSTSSNVYPLFASATSGTALTVNTGNAKLLYKPSTGELQASVPVALNGIVVNSQTVATSYTIAAGYSGMSAGPVTVASGQSVTVSSGSRWVVQ